MRLLASGVLMALSVMHSTTGSGTTQFGASVYRGSSSWHSAVQRSDDRYGGLEVVRVFYPGMPQPWKNVTSAVDTSLVVSFKAQPNRILSGADDQRLKQWFADAPRDRDIWWTYYHEPENNVEHGDFTAEQWRAAYKHIAAIANAADNPHLHNSIVLMCWTLDPSSGRSVADYFPGTDVVETIAWDCYSEPSTSQAYESPEDLYASAISTSRSLGVRWGIAETGSVKAPVDSSGELRAQWLLDAGQYLANEGAEFVVYFDSVVGGEFRLLDRPSQLAWRDVIARYGASS
ncbi:MAG: hypothetical protein ACJ73J_01600 [Actinomycetes bacterium]